MRKILSADGRVSFVGWFNIGELYTRWRGTHLRIKGDTVHEVERTFAGFWSLSLFGLHETNLEVYSEGFAGRLEAMFALDKTNAEELTLEKWETRPLPVKFFEKALKPLRLFG